MSIENTVGQCMSFLDALDAKEKQMTDIIAFVNDKRENLDIPEGMTSIQYFEHLQEIEEKAKEGVKIVQEHRKQFEQNEATKPFVEVAKIVRPFFK